MIALGAFDGAFDAALGGSVTNLLESFDNTRKLDLFYYRKGRYELNAQISSSILKSIILELLQGWGFGGAIHRRCKIRVKTATMSHPSTQTTKFLQHYASSRNLSILQLYEPTQKNKFNRSHT